MADLDGRSDRGPLVSRRIVLDADPMALYELSLREGWGDGLPLLPPTEQRVRSLLDAAHLDPDRSVATLPPSNAAATAELIAVNAALAGVEPAAFGHVVAAVRALADPALNLLGVAATTSSAAPALIVNGPSRRRLGFDHEGSCLGGAAGRASSTVGRAVQLCLRNIGGQRPDVTTKSVFGQPARVSGLCFGEWEERSPWPSLAERHGYPASQDVVSAHVTKGLHAFADGNTIDEHDLVTLIARTLAVPLSNAFHGPAERGQTMLLINPVWASRFGRTFPDVADFCRALHDRAWLPLDAWPPPGRQLLESKGRVGPRDRVWMHASPEQFLPVVCGGLGGLHAIALPTWGDSRLSAAAVRAG